MYVHNAENDVIRCKGAALQVMSLHVSGNLAHSKKVQTMWAAFAASPAKEMDPVRNASFLFQRHTGQDREIALIYGFLHKAPLWGHWV